MGCSGPMVHSWWRGQRVRPGNGEAPGGVEVSGRSKQGLLSQGDQAGWLQRDWGENSGPSSAVACLACLGDPKGRCQVAAGCEGRSSKERSQPPRQIWKSSASGYLNPWERMRSPRKKGPEKGAEAQTARDPRDPGGHGPRGQGPACFRLGATPAPEWHLPPRPLGPCRGAAGTIEGKEGSGEKPGEESTGSGEWPPGWTSSAQGTQDREVATGLGGTEVAVPADEGPSRRSCRILPPDARQGREPQARARAQLLFLRGLPALGRAAGREGASWGRLRS